MFLFFGRFLLGVLFLLLGFLFGVPRGEYYPRALNGDSNLLQTNPHAYFASGAGGPGSTNIPYQKAKRRQERTTRNISTLVKHIALIWNK